MFFSNTGGGETVLCRTIMPVNQYEGPNGNDFHRQFYPRSKYQAITSVSISINKNNKYKSLQKQHVG